MPYEPSPIDPEVKRTHLLGQAGEERQRQLAQLERDLVATIPQSSLDILASAFAVRHGKNGIADWADWAGRAIPCPLDARSIEAVHHRTLEVYSLRAAASLLESQTLDAAGER